MGEAGLGEMVRNGLLEVVMLKPNNEKELALRRSQRKTSWQSK